MLRRQSMGGLALLILLTALPLRADAANGEAAFDPSGEWDIRWDRGFAGWQPAIFEGRLRLERDRTRWFADLRFFNSSVSFVCESVTFDHGELDIKLTGTGRKGEEAALRAWFHDGRLQGEFRWGPNIGWTPLGGRRSPDRSLHDRAKGKPARIDAARLKAMLVKAADEESTALVLIEDGKLIVDAYRADYDDKPIFAMSASKSIVSLAIGQLIAAGKLTLDTSVGSLFAELERTPNAPITIRQLLSHTSGLDPARSNYDKSIFQHTVASKPNYKPGARFQYNNHAVDLLSVIVRRVSGVPLDEYLQTNLFSRIGVSSAIWKKDPEGNPRGAGELMITPRDLAKVGQLLLDGGRWNGAQIVPEGWIKQSTAAAQPFTADCGMLWWREGTFSYLLTDAILEAWLDVGIAQELIAKARPLVGKRFQERSEYNAALKQALGEDDDKSLLAKVASSNHLPYVYRAQEGEARGYSARGWLGQYLVVIPEAKLVAVRMRRAGPTDNGSDRNSYFSFGDEVVDLVQPTSR